MKVFEVAMSARQPVFSTALVEAENADEALQKAMKLVNTCVLQWTDDSEKPVEGVTAEVIGER